jgi:hypothetical protein
MVKADLMSELGFWQDAVNTTKTNLTSSINHCTTGNAPNLKAILEEYKLACEVVLAKVNAELAVLGDVT